MNELSISWNYDKNLVTHCFWLTVPGGSQKCPTGQNAISRQLIEIFIGLPEFIVEGVFYNPWKFHLNIFITSRITALYSVFISGKATGV